MRTVARDTILEAVRGRWLWMAALGALAVAAIAAFASGLALAEDRAVAIAFAAPIARMVAVLIVALTAITSLVREQSERTQLLALAAPMSRTGWLLGKVAGLAVIAALTGMVLALPLALFGPDLLGTLVWVLSLILELVLMATVCLAIGVVLTQIPPAVCAAIAFYVLARDLHVVQLLAARAENYSDFGPAGPVIQAVAAVFPRLDLFTRTEWLLPGGAAGHAFAHDLGAAILQAVIYSLLAFSVAVLDLRRAPLG
jgi:hypothetical protein